MAERRIGRVLVASLHQAIGDIVPTRLEFYENWLNSNGLRYGTIGLAPMIGVLGFLRQEECYALIATRAGEYAASWTADSMAPARMRVLQILPVFARRRIALGAVRRLVADTYPGTRFRMSSRAGTVTIHIGGSIFCDVREAAAMPLCGYYEAAARRMLERLRVPAQTTISTCRASGGQDCQIAVELRRTGSDPVPQPAA
jgi:bacteriochlorophyll 4-vinyl reductase